MEKHVSGEAGADVRIPMSFAMSNHSTLPYMDCPLCKGTGQSKKNLSGGQGVLLVPCEHCRGRGQVIDEYRTRLAVEEVSNRGVPNYGPIVTAWLLMLTGLSGWGIWIAGRAYLLGEGAGTPFLVCGMVFVALLFVLGHRFRL